jgi:hypothetical protein
MKRISLLLLSLISLVCSAREINGKIVETDGTPVELANIKLYSLPDSAYITGTTSNTKGEFTFANVKQRRAYLSISSVGYETVVVPVTDYDKPLSIVLKSTTVNLGEVTIKAKSRYINGEKMVFMPSKQDKEISAEGVDLLKNMSLPLIKIDPVNNSVSSITGENVSFYIDYQPATERDVRGLLTKDVIHVEYLDAPTDPRFHGDQHVVNFIMRQYEFGGYTKLRAGQHVVNNFGSYGLDSKFVRKSMTYDLSAGYDYSNNDHLGLKSLSDYDFSGQHISRLYETLDGKIQQNSYYATLRARYSSKKFVATNTIGFQYNKTPEEEYNATVGFTPQIYSDGASYSLSSSKDYSATWKGNFDIFMRDKSMLTVEANGTYLNNDDNYKYTAKSADVYNTTSETAWNGSVDLRYTRSAGKKGHIAFNVLNSFREHDIAYGGTSDYDANLWRYTVSTRFRYDVKFNKTFALLGYAEYSFTRDKQNGKYYNDHIPNMYVGLTTTFNQRNSLRIGSNILWTTTPISYRTENYIRQNEIDVITGNSNLKRSLMYNVTARYVFMPIDELTFVPYVSYINTCDAISFQWNGTVSENGVYSMLRRYTNDGSFSTLRYGCGISLNLFNKSLSINSTPVFTTYHRSGSLKRDNTYFAISNYANYKFGSFYVNGSYTSSQTAQTELRRMKMRPYYSFGAGYGKNGLNVSLSFLNIFNSSYRGEEDYTYGDIYTLNEQYYSRTYHRAIQFSVSYSFNYGKRVRQDNGVGKTMSIGSAALK